MDTSPRADLEPEIRQLITQQFPAVESLGLGAEDNLLESGAVDSLGLLVIVNLLETKFGFKVEDTDVVMENFGSLRALARYVERRKTS
jgi:acyl carrier protein